MTANTIDAAGTVAQIKSFLLTNPTGMALSDVQLTGSIDAVGVFDSVNLSPTFNITRGVLITTGDGTPPRTNSSGSYGPGLGLAGNADLSAFADNATTNDATVLTLTFNVSSSAIKSIKFNVAFGSDEYNGGSSITTITDIGSVWTGTGTSAKNYALVDGKADQPLSVTQHNADLGNFIDNTAGGLPIEYDGLIKNQTIYVPVHQGVNVIQVGIADTSDSVYDSGLFISGIEGSSSTDGGTYQQVDVSKGGKYDAGDINALFEGLAQAFNGVVITSFSDLDKILIQNSFFSDIQALLGIGSMVLKFDTDKDGNTDTKIELKDPINGTLHITNGPDGTTVTVDPLKHATSKSDKLNGTSHLDYLDGKKGADTLDGKGGSDALLGGAGNDKIFGGKGADTISGGTGADKMYAGKGDDHDVFLFEKGDAGSTSKTWDQIFQFDAKVGNEKISDKIDLSDLHVKWSDIDLHSKHGDTFVEIDYKGSHKADMVIEVMNIDHLHKADFIL